MARSANDAMSSRRTKKKASPAKRGGGGFGGVFAAPFKAVGGAATGLASGVTAVGGAVATGVTATGTGITQGVTAVGKGVGSAVGAAADTVAAPFVGSSPSSQKTTGTPSAGGEPEIKSQSRTAGALETVTAPFKAAGDAVYKGAEAVGGAVYRGAEATGGAVYRGVEATGGAVYKGGETVAGAVAAPFSRSSPADKGKGKAKAAEPAPTETSAPPAEPAADAPIEPSAPEGDVKGVPETPPPSAADTPKPAEADEVSADATLAGAAAKAAEELPMATDTPDEDDMDDEEAEAEADADAEAYAEAAARASGMRTTSSRSSVAVLSEDEEETAEGPKKKRFTARKLLTAIFVEAGIAVGVAAYARHLKEQRDGGDKKKGKVVKTAFEVDVFGDKELATDSSGAKGRTSGKDRYTTKAREAAEREGAGMYPSLDFHLPEEICLPHQITEPIGYDRVCIVAPTEEEREERNVLVRWVPKVDIHHIDATQDASATVGAVSRPKGLSMSDDGSSARSRCGTQDSKALSETGTAPAASKRGTRFSAENDGSPPALPPTKS